MSHQAQHQWNLQLGRKYVEMPDCPYLPQLICTLRALSTWDGYLGHYLQGTIAFTKFKQEQKNLNKCVLRFLLKPSTDWAVLMCSDRLFQALAALTVKLQPPMARFVLGTTQWILSMDHCKTFVASWLSSLPSVVKMLDCSLIKTRSVFATRI